MQRNLKNKVMALIPARSGSQGLKDKNIFALRGFPLLAYSVAVAKLCDEVDRVVVSTNSENYANIAKLYGADVPFLRPDNISESNSMDIEYLRFTLTKLMESEGCIPEYILLLRPTTPIRNPHICSNALNIIMKNSDISSVVSVSVTSMCPYKWMKINEKGCLTSLFLDMKPDDVNLPRQNFPKAYIPNGYIDILRSKTILEDGYVYGYSAMPFLIDGETVDIDSINDIQSIPNDVIENSILYKYLCSHYN
jgi:CMP-N-acetylneuraminic acid synthetase